MSKNIILAGFHAVGARLRKDPDSIVCVYVDPQRRDKRMTQMRAELESFGVRVMQAGHDRLSGMVSGIFLIKVLWQWQNPWKSVLPLMN